MALPNPEHVRQAFENQYYRENGTLEGVGDAFLWWSDPGLECAIATRPRGGKKCKAPCPNCILMRQRRAA